VVPDGTECADGSEFHCWVREADPSKVLLHFGGGGACSSAETCAQDGSDGSEGLYTPAPEAAPMGRDGIFDLADERNPFADYSIMFVPPPKIGAVHASTSTTKSDAPEGSNDVRGEIKADLALRDAESPASCFPGRMLATTATSSGPICSVPVGRTCEQPVLLSTNSYAGLNDFTASVCHRALMINRTGFMTSPGAPLFRSQPRVLNVSAASLRHAAAMFNRRNSRSSRAGCSQSTVEKGHPW
jgi:hypothetical protein